MAGHSRLIRWAGGYSLQAIREFGRRRQVIGNGHPMGEMVPVSGSARISRRRKCWTDGPELCGFHRKA